MAVKGKKMNNSNAYDGNAMSFPPYASSSINRYANKPKKREDLMQRKQQPTNRKADNRKYKDAKGRKRKKVDPNRKYRLEKEKRIRKGRDYFFIMRKFLCFIVFLLFAVCIGLFALGYLKIMPEYTSLFVEPDYTPKDERIATPNEEDQLIDYVDKSQHISMVDPIFGFIKSIIPSANLGESPKYDEMIAKVEAGGVADIISQIAITYYPIAMLLFIIVALINMVKAFLGMFGKRIYRLFGLSAFWMIIFGFIVIIGGVASNMMADQNLDFNQIVPFILGFLQRLTKTGPETAAGFGLLAMIALPVIILILSMFMKKKVPYSIFD